MENETPAKDVRAAEDQPWDQGVFYNNDSEANINSDE
jgi:hypothetical protein